MNTTIQKSKKYLDNFVSQNIIVKQHGFIESYFEIKNFGDCQVNCVNSKNNF